MVPDAPNVFNHAWLPGPHINPWLKRKSLRDIFAFVFVEGKLRIIKHSRNIGKEQIQTVRISIKVSMMVVGSFFDHISAQRSPFLKINCCLKINKIYAQKKREAITEQEDDHHYH